MGAWVGRFGLFWLVHLISFWGVYADDTCLRKPGQGPCMCTTTTNIVVDLTNIRNNLNPKPADNKPTFGIPVVEGFKDPYLYSYSPCKSFTDESCQDVSVSLRIQSYFFKKKYGAGKLDTAKFSGDYFKNELLVTYTDGERNSTVFLRCSLGEVGKLQPHGELKPGSKHYVSLTDTSRLMFSNGISTGSILLILFFVSVIVYLVGGTLLKHFLQGARGWEQIPNVSFWRDFPSLVRVSSHGLTYI
ncbi:hypothetical protein NP493_3697g00000 [Ridgeia piscesae]|uniref:Autophagy-related protein 27 n=1 Tax=Ridgeia piscesae TaxID=27915 RepID=A0AAD9J589_RIDPI|nr:hypothetical protein NP493_3697g00000 [Ridgeia piscesae]